MRNILIIGATSAIARETARVYAQQGSRLYLLARDQERLAMMAKDLKIRGAAEVQHDPMDVNDFDAHQRFIDTVFDTLGPVDVVLIAHGTLPDQRECETNFRSTLNELNTNAISTVSLLTHLANKFQSQQGGTIAVITSVAADRGRQSNYVYGASKAMVSAFLQGLRHRLYSSGVNVLDIKPGFIDTPMTTEFKKGLLWAKPEKIAVGIATAIKKRKTVVYLPWFWKYIMVVIILLPESIFNRLKL